MVSLVVSCFVRSVLVAGVSFGAFLRFGVGTGLCAGAKKVWGEKSAGRKKSGSEKSAWAKKVWGRKKRGAITQVGNTERGASSELELAELEDLRTDSDVEGYLSHRQVGAGYRGAKRNADCDVSKTPACVNVLRQYPRM